MIRHQWFTIISLITILSGPTAKAQTELLTPQLFEAMVMGINASGATVSDIPWPGYRIMDANGFLGLIGDVMGPFSQTKTYSTPSRILWSQFPKLKPQIRYDDFGGTCDYNNPSLNFDNQVRNAAYAIDDYRERRPNYNTANGLESEEFQNGMFNTCDDNSQFTKENFTPVPLITRFAWVYRSCKMLSVRTKSQQIARFVNRIRSPDPIATNPNIGTGYTPAIKVDANDNNGQTVEPNYNWCTNISYPTPEDYQKLFRAFYPGRTIPKNLLTDFAQQGKAVSGSTTQVKRSVSLLNASPLQITSYPRYYERLVDLVNESDAFIATLGPSQLPDLEDNCNSASNSGTPTLENIKAINAWRALLMISCMDPGPQVY